MQTIFTENKQQENLLMTVISRIIALLRDIDFFAHLQDGSAKQSLILCFCISCKRY